MLLGALYFQIGTTGIAAVQNRMGIFMLEALFLAFTSVSALPVRALIFLCICVCILCVFVCCVFGLPVSRCVFKYFYVFVYVYVHIYIPITHPPT